MYTKEKNCGRQLSTSSITNCTIFRVEENDRVTVSCCWQLCLAVLIAIHLQNFKQWIFIVFTVQKFNYESNIPDSSNVMFFTQWKWSE